MQESEWLAARRGKMSSSVVGGALGLNPHMSPIQAWLAIRGESEPIVDRAAIDRGKRLEDIILAYPAERRGLRLEAAEFRSSEWTADSADGVYRDPADGKIVAVGEGKSASLATANEWGEAGTDDVPMGCLVQSMWHLLHWPEADECIVPSLIGGYRFEFREYSVRRDSDAIAKLRDAAREWYDRYVVTGEPPPATHRDLSWLSARYPELSDDWLADTPEIEALAREKDRWATARKEAAKKEDDAKARIRQLLGSHVGVKGHWGKVTYIEQRGRIRWEGVAQALHAEPELIEQHRGRGIRTLRITMAKEGQAS